MRRSSLYLILILVVILIVVMVTRLRPASVVTQPDTGNALTVQAQNGAEIELAGSARVVCTESCRGQGQCGPLEADANNTVVLMSSAAPSTSGHDTLVQNDNAITILESRQVDVRHIINGTPSLSRFYRVRVDNLPNLPESWVGGWCVEKP